MRIYIQISLISLFFSLMLVSCNNNTYCIDEEAYDKYVYLLGYGDYNIFTLEYEYGENEIGYLPVHCSGSLPIDTDIEVKLELYPELVENYNKREYDIVTSKYAKALDHSRFSMDNMTLILKKGEKNPYSLLPVKADINGLSPDSVYFIPLKIASTSAYKISENNNSNVLLQIQMKNEYASSAKDIIYKLSSAKSYVGKDSTVFVSGQKILKPIAKNVVRMYPETYVPSKDTELLDIQNNGILLTIKEDNTIDITSYKNLQLTQNTDSISRYDPIRKEFTVFYQYKDQFNTYFDVHEIFSLFE